MNRTFLPFWSIFIFPCFLLIAFGCASNRISEAKYSVVEKDGKFELRDYEPQIVAETIVNADFENAGDEAFERLFKFISGNNKPAKKIAMTVPVSQEPAGEKINMTVPVSQKQHRDKWIISFMMPSSYTMETVPLPKDSRITLRRIPARRMGVVRYSGRWTLENYEEYKTELKNWMQSKKLKPAGEVVWARYNPPWTLWFLRRNEVLCPVISTKPVE